MEQALSKFEEIFTINPSIFESLLLQIPTETVISLYHLSRNFRAFLQSYPLAWKTLSFRQVAPGSQQLVPASSTESPERLYETKRPFSINNLLETVGQYMTALALLDLDNTCVYGTDLVSEILKPRKHTLKHLSVRGCKNVSLKYHILPFLDRHYNEAKNETGKKEVLALASLYTYRCKHHRRRPYLQTSLKNHRDSDAGPTHELIVMCNQLDIYTDTAWCSTPGYRCSRRSGYASSRGASRGGECWVPFDRMWRSKNYLGRAPVQYVNTDSWPPKEVMRKERMTAYGRPVGRLWKDEQSGRYGEALTTGWPVETKHVPMHKRKSHRTFVEDVKCHECGEDIQERCEQCSMWMHCRGCRKTYCASCAFNLAIVAETGASRRNPNILSEEAPGRKIKWCCQQPAFSGGGTPFFLGHCYGDILRTVPLPPGQGYDDKAFEARADDTDVATTTFDVDIMPYVEGPSLELAYYERWTAPRSLCPTCYDSPRWNVKCSTCHLPLCIDHELKILRVRRCGWRKISTDARSCRNMSENAKKGEICDRRQMLRTYRVFLTKWKPLINEIMKDGRLDMSLNRSRGPMSRAAAAMLIDGTKTAGLFLSGQQSLAATCKGTADCLNDFRNSKGFQLCRVTQGSKAVLSAVGSDRTMRARSSSLPSYRATPIPLMENDILAQSLNLRNDPTMSWMPGTDGIEQDSSPPSPDSYPSTAMETPLALPKWTGCGRYFCAARSQYDGRTRCDPNNGTNSLHECRSCEVYACRDCREKAGITESDDPCPDCKLSKGFKTQI